MFKNTLAWMTAGGDVPWFGQVPISGTVPADDSIYPTMLFSATMAAGVDQGTRELLGLPGSRSEKNSEAEKLIFFFTDGQQV